MIQRAKDNAKRNNIENVQFYVNDLAEDLVSTEWSKQKFDKVLLDPPRSGAEAIIELIANTDAERIVYVSCHPGSLARDAGELSKQGYKLQDAGVMDMFPHTAHVESIALFIKR
jgi:23S rRNA (uracil1939-C5)-methyltransferase